VYGTDYTASALAKDDTGGILTLLTELPAEAAGILIRRKTPVTQEIELHDNSRLHAKTIEEMADKVTMETQEIRNLGVDKDDLQNILHEVNVIIETEKGQRISADTALNQKIDAETEEREKADGELGGKVEEETAAREEADSELDGRITAETAEREQAVEGAKDYTDAQIAIEEKARDAAISEAVGGETEARQEADTALNQKIETETEEREKADGELDGKIEDETAARQEADSGLNEKIEESGTEIAELQAFHAWNAATQYAPFNPVFYKGYPYYANPANMPLAGQNPAEYPAKWIVSGGGGSGGAVTVDGIHADIHGNIRLKYFVTQEEYRELKAEEKLIPGARYITTDKWRLPSVRDFSWMFTKICALLAAVPKEKTQREEADTALGGKIEDETEAREEADGLLQDEAAAVREIADAALPKSDVVVPDGSATAGQAADAAVLHTIIAGLMKLVSAATQEVFSNLALKTYVDAGSGQTRAYQLMGTAIDGTAHTLIELAEYGAAQQIEIGSETIHLNLNNLGPAGGDNHITCDTHDGDGAPVKLSVAWLSDVIAQCAATLASSNTYTDSRVEQFRVDVLVLQNPCKESELQGGPFDPSHNGYFYQITDFDISYPGENRKGSAVWYDSLNNYYLAVDTYKNADEDTITENSNGEFMVADVETGTIVADTSGGFADNVVLGFKTFIAAVIAKINGLFSQISGLTNAVGAKYTKPAGGIPVSDLNLSTAQLAALNSGITSDLLTAVSTLTWSDYFTAVNANIQIQNGAAMYRSCGEARLRLPFLNTANAFTGNTAVFNPVAGKITTPNLGTFYGDLYAATGGLTGTCWIQEINNVLMIAPLPGTTIAANTGLVIDIRFPL
jgi:hypothetical protein